MTPAEYVASPAFAAALADAGHADAAAAATAGTTVTVSVVVDGKAVSSEQIATT